jgi:hypothetical protein
MTTFSRKRTRGSRHIELTINSYQYRSLAPSRQRGLDMWSLHLPTQQELLSLVESTLGSQVCTDPFACRQNAVAPRQCHTSALSSQCSLQRLAPRLVSTRHALAQPAMVSTDSSFGKASSVKSKRYPGLPLLVPSVMVPRSAAAVRLPLQPVTSTSLRQIAPPRPRRDLRQSRGASAGSGLRLCVKDDLLQAGVLLVTQGATDEHLTVPRKRSSPTSARSMPSTTTLGTRHNVRESGKVRVPRIC